MLLVTIIFILLGFSNEYANAESINKDILIECESGSGNNDNYNILITPGKSSTLRFSIKNNGNEDIDITKINIRNFCIEDILNESNNNLKVEIIEELINNLNITVDSESQTLCEGNLSEVESNNDRVLETKMNLEDNIRIYKRGQKDFNLILYLNEDISNNLQGLRCSFDIQANYKAGKRQDETNIVDGILPQAGGKNIIYVVGVLGVTTLLAGILLSKFKV
ncbi:hypothetical protein [Clostridium sp.]|uniref:hypothetical protein n=1 Tax=Clostridium sp. TaxID=1506 RepID=UPI003217A330